MPTALIADDEEAPRARLVAALAQVWPELEVVGEYMNGLDAWDAYLERDPRVCFLDVRMPGLTGIEVAQRIGAGAHIVFVTAESDHALAAFDAGAVDYVRKPVDTARLVQAVARVKARLEAPGSTPFDLQRLLEKLVGQVRKPAPIEVIQAGAGKDVRLVPVDDVVYFEADSRYTRLVCRPAADDELPDGEVVVRTPLKELIGQLDPARFWQVHRSVVVNRRHIAGACPLDQGRMELLLRDRTERLPVSNHFQGLFRGPWQGDPSAHPTPAFATPHAP